MTCDKSMFVFHKGWTSRINNLRTRQATRTDTMNIHSRHEAVRLCDLIFFVIILSTNKSTEIFNPGIMTTFQIVVLWWW